jgi:hypothetical protein
MKTLKFDAVMYDYDKNGKEIEVMRNSRTIMNQSSLGQVEVGAISPPITNNDAKTPGYPKAIEPMITAIIEAQAAYNGHGITGISGVEGNLKTLSKISTITTVVGFAAKGADKVPIPWVKVTGKVTGVLNTAVKTVASLIKGEYEAKHVKLSVSETEGPGRIGETQGGRHFKVNRSNGEYKPTDN